MDYFNQVQNAASYLQGNGFTNIDTAIVLGTGLGKLLSKISIIKEIPYDNIPGFMHATVESHKGKLILGTIGQKRIIAMQGRFHFYEGYTMQQITFPVRVMKLLEVKNLLLSNASGGINLSFKKGGMVLITDHINMQSENPLRGLNSEKFGPRFPDMSIPYDKKISSIIEQEANNLNLNLHHGVYVSVNGPNLETRAEYRMLKMMGADMVGMSTVPEVIVANQIGLPCAAVSVITDECDPDNLLPVDIKQIIAAANDADEKLSSLFVNVIQAM